ncbi:hypothetical protein ARMGADRAFT_1022726 [Armillaria gallica]|uniref:Uncharacterized protein n=1 Tax=Armillaria gallica TaxID=47427 RepID=A0A2H3EA36_ARMGA|nr:hypothetical protein ARMGADRAFT_1022726 [Armillaria gallica]
MHQVRVLGVKSELPKPLFANRGRLNKRWVCSFSNGSNYRMDERECSPDTFDSYMGLYIEMYLLTFDGVFFFLWTIIIELLIMAASMGHRGGHHWEEEHACGLPQMVWIGTAFDSPLAFAVRPEYNVLSRAWIEGTRIPPVPLVKYSAGASYVHQNPATSETAPIA